MLRWPKRTGWIFRHRFRSSANRFQSCVSASPKRWPNAIQALSNKGTQPKPMKKLFCILAGAALLGACEQKETVVAPASSPAPDKKVEHNTTVVNPTTEKTKETKETTNTNTTTTA